MGHPEFRWSTRLLLMPGRVYVHWNFVLDGDSEECRRIDFEIEEGRRNRAGDVMSVTLNNLVKGDMGKMRCVAGELDFKVAIEHGGIDGGFGQTKADGDDRKLCATRGLKHMQVAVGVAGVECFN